MGSVKRTGYRPPPPLWGLALLWAALALASPQLAAAASAAPLPESDYTVHSACSAPAPGRPSCMALELERRTTAAQAQLDPLAAAKARLDSLAGGGSGGSGDGSSGGAPTSLKTAKACAKEFPSGCLTPEELRNAYFPSEEPLASKPQTIALVDAYNDPKAEADLKVYSEAFGLPVIQKCSGSDSQECFEQVSQSGTTTLPFPKTETARQTKETACDTAKTKESRQEFKKREEACDELVEAEGWDVEISTDIEVAHAICQNCKILLVEANAAVYKELEEAEETAVRLGATEVSNSWGGPQEQFSDQAFNHPGTVITAAAGDSGYLNWTEAEEAEKARREGKESGYFVGADFPASSPDVVAVGGTKLTMVKGVRQSETAWNEDPDPEGENQGAGGGGCAGESFTAQRWQQAVPDWSLVGCGAKRAVADVSADADPYTGVAVYDSVPTIEEPKPGEVLNEPLEWWPVGGTSVASPLIGSMFALAGGADGVEYPAETLYSHLETAALHDVTKGGNGKCDDLYTSCSGSLSPLSSSFAFDCGEGALICNAAPGCGDEYYDGPTGVGTPNGIAALEPGKLPTLAKPECEQKSKPSKEEIKTEAPGSKGSGSEGPSGGQGSPNGATGGQNTGGSSSTGSTSGGSGAGAQGGSPGAKTSLASSAPRVSALTLTANARAALHRLAPALTRLAFSCVLSRSAKVRVTLSTRIRSAGRTRWRKLPTSLTFNAVKGLNRRRLHGAGDLAPGVYRLTLTPAGGTARSITFRVV
jgi:hypothetical protein